MMDSGVVFFLSPNGAVVRSPGREPWDQQIGTRMLIQPRRGDRSYVTPETSVAPPGLGVISQGLLRVSQGSRPGLWTTAPLGLGGRNTPESILSAGIYLCSICVSSVAK